MEIHCEMGERNFYQKFDTKEEAASFMRAMLGVSPTWKSPDVAVKDGVVLKSKDLQSLEKISEPAPATEEIKKTVDTFLLGDWTKLNGAKKPPVVKKSLPVKLIKKAEPEKKAPVGKVGLVSLAEMCKEHSWEARAVRMKLRKEKIKKPGDTWAWPSSEATKVATRLKALLK